MRDMNQTPEKMTLRYQLMAIARDVVTIATVVGILSGAFWFVARPYVTPYLELPADIAEFRTDLAKFQIQLAEVRVPRIVDFAGIGLIASSKEVRPGDRLLILYNLRRNAGCPTEIEVGFIDAENGTRIVTHTQRAVQAAVSAEFSPFLLRLTVPTNLPPGRYSYQPRMLPIDCGVYGPYLAALSEIFTVTEEG